MCLAIPGQVTKIKGRKATVKYPGKEQIALIGEEKVEVGDYVMVQMGIVINKLSAKEAKNSMKVWSGL